MDAEARRLIVAATAAENAQNEANAAAMVAMQGAAMAIGQLPPFELVELLGNVTTELFIAGDTPAVKFTIAGVGSPRAYVVKISLEWLHASVNRLADEHASSNGKPLSPDAAAEPETGEAAA